MVEGRVKGGPIEPGRKGPRLLNGPRLARDFEEHLLAGILGVLGVAKHSPADSEHGLLVVLQESGEGSAVLDSLVVLEQAGRILHERHHGVRRRQDPDS
jgi:hypothetical protein